MCMCILLFSFKFLMISLVKSQSYKTERSSLYYVPFPFIPPLFLLCLLKNCALFLFAHLFCHAKAQSQGFMHVTLHCTTEQHPQPKCLRFICLLFLFENIKYMCGSLLFFFIILHKSVSFFCCCVWLPSILFNPCTAIVHVAGLLPVT